MIDITRAQANQSTHNGVNGDWEVTLEGDKIYTLPARLSPQETFMIRDIIEKMMKKAVMDVKESEKVNYDGRINKLTENRDAALNELKAENERLATILDQHIKVD